MTIDEFIVEYHLGREEKWDLVDGEAWMTSGGSARHSLVAGRIITALNNKLGKGRCLAFTPDLLPERNESNGRLPDVGVYCDPRDLADLDKAKFRFPKILFEVIFDSTEAINRRLKVPAYQSIETVTLILLVDTREQRFETLARVGTNEWRNIQHPPGSHLVIDDPAMTLGASQVFGVYGAINGRPIAAEYTAS